MNELGIVLVVVFVLVLVVTVFNRGSKQILGAFFKKPTPEKTTHPQSEPTKPEPVVNHSNETSTSKQTDTDTSLSPSTQKSTTDKAEINSPKESERPNEHGGKHYVLEVDDPNMTGEKDAQAFPAMHTEPKFGRPEAILDARNGLNIQEPIKQPIESAPDPKAFVLVVRSNQANVPMERVNQIMRGLGAKLNEKNLYTYATKPIKCDGYVLIANLLEPGTFPTEQIESMSTPGVVLILELPTFVAASAAMHDMIMLARKLVLHFDATILDEKMQPVKESYLQSLREQSMEYDSKRIVS